MRLTTSILCMLISIPASAERYSFLLKATVSLIEVSINRRHPWQLVDCLRHDFEGFFGLECVEHFSFVQWCQWGNKGVFLRIVVISSSSSCCLGFVLLICLSMISSG
jgi:hypothetical protein